MKRSKEGKKRQKANLDRMVREALNHDDTLIQNKIIAKEGALSMSTNARRDPRILSYAHKSVAELHNMELLDPLSTWT